MGIVRIPLDYYRILGLPIQATTEQLQQAHRDRVQQLPRHEFSEAAIDARKQLIDQAYAVLSDPVQRQEYDTSFLAKSYDLIDGTREFSAVDSPDHLDRDGVDSDPELDALTPNVEIDESQFVGALLILLELGEYELVLRLARPHLKDHLPGLKDTRLGDPNLVSADIVLTVALAYLELGREQWQQGQYEAAALSLEQGQELLLREGIFANIRAEMQSDLFKLRPYRILELVSLPDEQEESRRQGISLLEDMLQDRNGIDGSGDDLSGLGVDDFLRFIQQLRGYLTSAEQQGLFEAEARRPSAVAIYLAVYALMARGFAQRQPALIRRAKMMLMRLGSQQDVHLEQAVCSLLLGQTDEASRALELSQEFESLAFIRDHSQGSPDLLPGLCLYSERWFQNEVFPHFRDLQNRQASLTEYFADEDVQLYLEELPAEAETLSARSSTVSAFSNSRRNVNLPADDRLPVEYPQPVGQTVSSPVGRRTATIDAPTGRSEIETGVRTGPPGGDSPTHQNGRPLRSAPQETSRESTARPVPARRGRSNLRLDRILLLAALGLLGMMLLGWLFGQLLRRPQPTANAISSTTVQTAETGLAAAVDGFGQTVAGGAPLTETNAPDIVKGWLEAKAAALGESHDVEALTQVLAEPALAEQQRRAEELKTANSYWQLEHSNIQIVSVETAAAPDETSDSRTTDSEPATASTDPTDPPTDSSQSATSDPASAQEQQGSIEAMVSEKGNLYVNGQLDSTSSYDSNVRVRYDLIQQDGQWRIRDMQVLE